MTILRSSISRTFRACGLVLALGAAACSNPVEDDHEEHAVGFVLTDAQGRNVVTVTTAAAGGSGATVTGQLQVAPGATQVFTASAVGEDGDAIPLGGELEVRVGSQPDHATLSIQGDRLTVVGRTAGSGTARIDLFHDGHADVGGPVPVVVQ